MHTITKTTMMTIKTNPTAMAMDMIMKMLWSSGGSVLVGEGVVEGVSILHSDWASAGTNRSHSKSTAYEMLFKKRAGPD